MANATWKNFERTVAFDVGEWWDNNKRHFRRLYLKAGWPWADGKGPDVVRVIDPSIKEPAPDAIDHSFFMWIECKKRKAFSFHDLMCQKPGEHASTEWFAETLRRAREAKKYPMVFVRYPNSPRIMIMIEEKFLLAISDLKRGRKGFRYMRVSVKAYERKKPTPVAVCLAKEFFKKITPEDMAKVYYDDRKKRENKKAS